MMRDAVDEGRSPCGQTLEDKARPYCGNIPFGILGQRGQLGAQMRRDFHRLGQQRLDLFLPACGGSWSRAAPPWPSAPIVFYVAMEMIWRGTHQVGCQFVEKATYDSGALTTLGALLSS
jgi:hypothetical protein